VNTGHTDLAERLERGEYVVDPRAVAEAMLRWSDRTRDSVRLTQMLVAAELRFPPGGVQKP
jgi:hypothetical protein